MQRAETVGRVRPRRASPSCLVLVCWVLCAVMVWEPLFTVPSGTANVAHADGRESWVVETTATYVAVRDAGRTSYISSAPSISTILGGFACSAILPAGVINSSVASVYANYNKSTVGGFPSQSFVSRQVLTMFNQVCAGPLFVALVDEWGAMNFSLGMFANDGGILYANFTEFWYVWSGGQEFSDREYWSGNATSGIVSGPYYQSSPAGNSYGGPSPRFPAGGHGLSSFPNQLGLIVAIAGSAVGALTCATAFRSIRTGRVARDQLSEGDRPPESDVPEQDLVSRPATESKDSDVIDPLNDIV